MGTFGLKFVICFKRVWLLFGGFFVNEERRRGGGGGEGGGGGGGGGGGDPEGVGVCVVLSCLHVCMGMRCLSWVIR